MLVPALIAVLLLIASHAFLSSDLLRREMESRLSASFKGRIAVERISPRGFRGIELSRVRFSAENGTTAQIQAIRLKFEISPLLRGKLYPDRVILTRPSANISLARSVQADTLPLSGGGTRPGMDGTKKSRSRVRLWPNHIELRDSTIDVIDSHLRPLFRSAGISGTLDGTAKTRLSGTLSGQSAEVLGTLRATPWTSAITIDRSTLQFRELLLPVGEGSLTINAEIDVERRTHSVEAEINRLVLPEKDLEGASTSLNGVISGRITLNGDLSGKDHLSGNGSINFHQVDFRPLQIVRTLGQVTGSNELTQLHPQPFKTDFVIENGALLVEKLTIESPVSSLTLRGSIRPDNTLDLACKLRLPPKLSSAKWLDDLGDAATALDESGQRTLNFNILGTTTKPHLDILEKIAKAVLRSKTSGLIDLLRPKGRIEPKSAEPANPDR